MSFNRTYKELKLTVGTLVPFFVELLIAPTRNWNYEEMNAFFLGYAFNRTYKELKHKTPTRLLENIPTFNRTYKELKRAKQVNVYDT